MKKITGRLKGLLGLGALVVFLLSLFSLAACQPTETAQPTPTAEPTPTVETETDLPFETIKKAEGSYYEGKQPQLVVVTEMTQVGTLGNMVSVDVQAQLRNLNLDQRFAVIAFLGWQPYVHPGIEIQRIGRKGEAITVYAHVLELVGEVRKPIVTSPYHAVGVQKGEDMQGEFQFVFNVDGRAISEQICRLP